MTALNFKLVIRFLPDSNNKKYRTRLDNALAMNRPLSEGYYLKEKLREIWMQTDRKAAWLVLLEWVKPGRRKQGATTYEDGFHRYGISHGNTCLV